MTDPLETILNLQSHIDVLQHNNRLFRDELTLGYLYVRAEHPEKEENYERGKSCQALIEIINELKDRIEELEEQQHDDASHEEDTSDPLTGLRFYWDNSEREQPIVEVVVMRTCSYDEPGCFMCARVLDKQDREFIAKFEDLKNGSEVGLPRLEQREVTNMKDWWKKKP